MALIRSIDVLTFDYPPDCIEFLPNEPDRFIVGTYHLEEDGGAASPSNVITQHRQGQLVLCSVETDSLHKIATIENNGGAYDLHFASSSTTGLILGVATSTGLLSTYDVTRDSIKLRCHHRLASKETLITSFAWHPTRPDCIAATQSDGAVTIFFLDLDDDTSSAEVRTILTGEVARHDEAAWHVTWNHSGTRLFHGGDDMVLGWVNVPSPPSDLSDPRPQPQITAFEERRVHAAGVTAVVQLFDSWILTGSYDDHLRVVKLPKIGTKVQSAAEMKFDDGVFRLSVLQRTESRLPGQSFAATVFASCMRAGARILRLEACSNGEDLVDWTITVLASFTENESLNYASAYSAGDIVSVSFYDKKAFLWRWHVVPP